jgi:choline-sulfatase
LKEAGYHIVWFGKNDMLSESAFKASVDRAYVPAGTVGRGENPYPLDDPHRDTFYYGRWDRGDSSLTDDLYVDEARRLIATSALPEPFCLFLPLSFVHPPYFVEEPYFSQYSPDHLDYIVPPRCKGKPMFMDLHYEYFGLARVEPEHVRRIRAAYYGMITRTDALFGQLVATLRDSLLYDRTAVVFVSDHGNYAGDFGVPTKWWTGFEDSLLRVPCAIRLPGQHRTGITDAMVQTIDVGSTILEIAGAASEWTHFGHSLVPLLNGERDTRRDAVYAEGGFHPDFETPFLLVRSTVEAGLPRESPYYQWGRLMREHPQSMAWASAVRTARWKYVWRVAELDELYDLQADPNEENNLLYTAPEQCRAPLEAMKDRLLSWSILTSGVVAPDKDIFAHLGGVGSDD